MPGARRGKMLRKCALHQGNEFGLAESPAPDDEVMIAAPRRRNLYPDPKWALV